MEGINILKISVPKTMKYRRQITTTTKKPCFYHSFPIINFYVLIQHYFQPLCSPMLIITLQMLFIYVIFPLLCDAVRHFVLFSE